MTLMIDEILRLSIFLWLFDSRFYFIALSFLSEIWNNDISRTIEPFFDDIIFTLSFRRFLSILKTFSLMADFFQSRWGSRMATPMPPKMKTLFADFHYVEFFIVHGENIYFFSFWSTLLSLRWYDIIFFFSMMIDASFTRDYENIDIFTWARATWHDERWKYADFHWWLRGKITVAANIVLMCRWNIFHAEHWGCRRLLCVAGQKHFFFIFDNISWVSMPSF